MKRSCAPRMEEEVQLVVKSALGRGRKDMDVTVILIGKGIN